MSLPRPPYDQRDVEVITSEPLYQGFFRADKVQLRHRLFEGGWSAPITREVFLRGDAVGVVLYDPKQDLIGLVEQFRVGAKDKPHSPWCMEVVAGICEQGESLEQVALREIEEETGLQAQELQYICEYMASPGGCNETLHLFCAQLDLSNAGGVFGLVDEGEDIKLHILSAEAVFKELYGGRFNNAATLISLQWLQWYRSQRIRT